MSSTDLSLDLARQRLKQARQALLRLHKALLDSERRSYEEFYMPIRTRGEFFQLVIEHEWFSWLRPMSQLIVQIDEALSAKEPVTLNEVNQLLEATQQLVQPSEAGTASQKRYYQAIQRDPEIALIHAETTRLLAQ